MSKILQSQRYWCNFFRQGHLTMVVLLLGCGADPTLRDGQGEFMITIYCTCISGIFHDHLSFHFHIEKIQYAEIILGIVWH